MRRLIDCCDDLVRHVQLVFVGGSLIFRSFTFRSMGLRRCTKRVINRQESLAFALVWSSVCLLMVQVSSSSVGAAGTIPVYLSFDDRVKDCASLLPCTDSYPQGHSSIPLSPLKKAFLVQHLSRHQSDVSERYGGSLFREVRFRRSDGLSFMSQESFSMFLHET